MVALIEGDHDGIVADLPHRRRGDLVDEFTSKLVALCHQPALLHGSRVVRVHTPGRRTVHVAAFVGDDVAEVGNGSVGKVGRQPRKRKHLCELGRRLKIREIHDAIVFGDVKLEALMGMPREPIRVVAIDPERVPAQHGDVIGLTRIGDTTVLRRETIIPRQCINDGRE